MTQALPPRWVMLTAGAVLVAWVAGLCATAVAIPGERGASAAVAAAAAVAPVDPGPDLVARIDGLTGQVERLERERIGLLARIEALESARAKALWAAEVEAALAFTSVPEREEDPTKSRFFTNGQDLLNCIDFKTMEEAIEALRVNGPGDPNRIDTNRNGIPCEDRFRGH
jgi:hypothetical protein